MLTNSVDSASRFVAEFEALVDVPAARGFGVPRVTALTDADAAADELVFDALFASGARCAGSADVGQLGLAATAVVRVARHSAWAETFVVAGQVPANRALWAGLHRALVDVLTTVLGFAGVATVAQARGHVVEQHAVGVGTAGQVLAWICWCCLSGASGENDDQR